MFVAVKYETAESLEYLGDNDLVNVQNLFQPKEQTFAARTSNFQCIIIIIPFGSVFEKEITNKFSQMA